MFAPVFDLRSQKTWRVFRTEDHQRGHRLDPSHLELRGRYGSIYPYSASQLCAFTDRRLIRSRLLALPFSVEHQQGDYELVVRFPTANLDDVAALLRCFRKRHLSPERKAIASANLAAQRRARTSGRKSESAAPDRSPRSGSDDHEPPSPTHEGTAGGAL